MAQGGEIEITSRQFADDRRSSNKGVSWVSMHITKLRRAFDSTGVSAALAAALRHHDPERGYTFALEHMGVSGNSALRVKPYRKVLLATLLAEARAADAQR